MVGQSFRGSSVVLSKNRLPLLQRRLAENAHQGEYWLERVWRDLHSDVPGWQGYLSNFAWTLSR